jgi:purine-binding chemotaxis protein CheW
MTMAVLESAVSLTQYLSFNLESETFAMEIGQVREVLDYTSVTKVPQMPSFVRGVINLRGSVVPVVDLKRKFGMGLTESGLNTCIIIVDVEIEGGDAVLGILADSVQEVFSLDRTEIEPMPRIGSSMSLDFLKGMGRRDDEFVQIMDVGRVFTDREMLSVHAAAAMGMHENAATATGAVIELGEGGI